jgi:23S rRNA (cytosine1962-C5)-methyltransferase
VRGRGAKVSAAAARSLRGGHPWVFRDSLRRPLDGVEAGTTIRVDDEEGRVIGWGLVEPEGAVAVRLVSRDPDFRWDADAMAERVTAAAAYRKAHLPDTVRQCHRLVHGEADGLPGLAVDRLGDYLLMCTYSRAAHSYVDAILPVLESAFSPRGIYLQDRVRPVTADETRPPAAHVAGKPAPVEFEVEEEGLRFVVDVTAPVSTGLFLDLREGRRLCESLAGGCEVLNLFSFTGAFALRALRGGAKRVVNVDSAARSHARCRQNLSASGMDPEACEALTGDAFKHLERMRSRQRLFDLVVVDPPPFSRVRNRAFSALRDWSELMNAVTAVVAPGGQVLVVSNASGLPEADLLSAVGEGALRGGRIARLVGERGLPPDFPVLPAFVEGRYLKIKLLQIP